MFTLVKFEDGIYYVCRSSNITVNEGILKAKYSDKRKYPATIIARNGKLKILFI